MRSIILIGLSLLSYSSFTQAANSTTPNRAHCVDPIRFDACFKNADNTQAKCVKDAKGDNSTITTCQRKGYETKLNCYLSFCWNKVYSCEYQFLANQLVDSVLDGGGSIPCYPAPDNAPGGCSCNIGKLYHNFTESVRAGLATCNQTQTDASDVKACDCCAFGSAFAAFYAYCPQTDANSVSLSDAINRLHLFEGRLASCVGAYNASTCESKYGFAPPAGNKTLSADSLPSWTGTSPLSTMSGSLTSPPGGPTVTWTAVDDVLIATAAPYNAQNAASTATSAARRGSKIMFEGSWMFLVAASLFGMHV